MSVNTVTSRDVAVTYPYEGRLVLDIEAGACNLVVSAADQAEWLTGSYVDDSGQIPLEIEQSRGRVGIRARPPIFDFGLRVPSLELRLGKARPFELRIRTGASADKLYLGGLPITSLDVRNGVGTAFLEFNAPNPEVMTDCSLEVVAGQIEARDLANANFESLRLRGGEGRYLLDFGGTMKRDARVRLDPALGSIDLQMPKDLAAEIVSRGPLTRLEAGKGFEPFEGGFRTQAAAAGRRPSVRIESSMAAGRLRLRLSE